MLTSGCPIFVKVLPPLPKIIGKRSGRVTLHLESTKFNMADTPTTQAPDLLPALPLRKNLAWTLTGKLVYGGCLWGVLVAIAKLGTPDMLGQFALGYRPPAPLASSPWDRPNPVSQPLAVM